jgi:hypothetical protein
MVKVNWCYYNCGLWSPRDEAGIAELVGRMVSLWAMESGDTGLWIVEVPSMNMDIYGGPPARFQQWLLRLTMQELGVVSTLAHCCPVLLSPPTLRLDERHGHRATP